jgi:hypothetical protein
VTALADYLALRIRQPHFANARSVRNALDRARLRQASRLFAQRDRVLTRDDLSTLAEPTSAPAACSAAAEEPFPRNHHAPVTPLDADPLPDRGAPPLPAGQGDLNALILDVSLACKAIARIVAFRRAWPIRWPRCRSCRPWAAVNVQGEQQKPLDVLSNEIFIRMNEWNGHLAGLASEEMDEPGRSPRLPRGKYLLVFDPLDGSSNIDVNVSVGSIFSILRAPPDVIASGRDVTEADFLQPGARRWPPATRSTARRRCSC